MTTTIQSFRIYLAIQKVFYFSFNSVQVFYEYLLYRLAKTCTNCDLFSVKSEIDVCSRNIGMKMGTFVDFIFAE